MEGKKEGVGRRGRRTRLDSSATANLALKMPRCCVRLPIINVRKMQAEQRLSDEHPGKRTREQDDSDEISVKKLAKSDVSSYETLEQEGQTGASTVNENGRIDYQNEDEAIISELLEISEDAKKVNKASKECRVTRQRVKLTGKTILNQSKKTPPNEASPNTSVVPLEPSSSSSSYNLSPLDRESKSRSLKYKSAKTGRVFEKHPCNMCDKVFSSSVGLKIHLSTHMFECKVCHLTFTTSKELQTHTEEHITSIVTTHQQIQCTVCGKEFSTQKLLRKHMETDGSHTRPFSCSLETCERTFTRRSHLINHRCMHPDARELECEKCAMKFSSKLSLMQHQKIPNCGKTSKVPDPDTEKKFRCLECEKCFSKIEYLEMHKNYHWEDLINCIPCRLNSCKLTFTSKNKLEKHMEEHTNIIRDGMFECTKTNCHERFKDTSLLKKHVENHSTVERCRICGQFFSSKLDMLLHRVVCMHEKKQTQSFSCSFCSKVFKAKRFLNNHVKVCGKSGALVSSNGKNLSVCSVHESEVALAESEVISTIVEGLGAGCAYSVPPSASVDNHKSFSQEVFNEDMRTVHRYVEENESLPLLIETSTLTKPIVDSIKLEAYTKSVSLREELPAETENKLVQNSENRATSIEIVVSKNSCDKSFRQEKDEKDLSLPSSPRLDNDLLDPYIPGSSIVPPLASSGLKVDHMANNSSSQDSVVIVEISEEGSSNLDIVSPVTWEKAEAVATETDQNKNELPEVLISEEDVIIEEVIEEIVESNTDKKDEHSLELVECFDSQVVFDMDLVEEDHAVLDVHVEHDKACDENSNLEQLQPDNTIKINPDIRKAALLTLYSSVVSAKTCPALGDFIKALKITQDMLGHLAIPHMLEPVKFMSEATFYNKQV